jgi:hypothetical protein
MIKTREMPPHLAQAVKRETSGLSVLWASMTGTKGSPKQARWIWVLAVPATVYMLVDSWNTLSLLLAVDIRAPGGFLKLGMNLADTVWTLLWLGLTVASLFVPAWVERKFGEEAHVITDTMLLRISATRYGSTTVDFCPLSSILAVERRSTEGDSGILTITAGHRRASDGDIFRRSFTMANVLEPQQVEELINSLSAKASATP